MATKKTTKHAELLSCFIQTCSLRGHPLSLDKIRTQLDEKAIEDFNEMSLAESATQNNIPIQPVKKKLQDFTSEDLPCILVLLNERYLILKQVYEDGSADTLKCGAQKRNENIKLRKLEETYIGKAFIFNKPSQKPEIEKIPPTPETWFWGTLKSYKTTYIYVALAAIFANLLALASPLFIMNVYDRVVPNQAIETLWVLASGVLIAFGFDFILKNLRSTFMEIAGKQADTEISSILFEQILNAKLQNRPANSAAFANTLKEFESLRDFYTSSIITVFVDLPFVLFFIMIIYSIGGAVIWPIVMALPIVLIVSYLLQKPISKTVAHQAKLSIKKHSILMESLRNLESVKTARAQKSLVARWRESSKSAAISAQKSKGASSAALHFAQLAQQVTTILVVIIGVYLMQENKVTVGALVACTILTGRSLAPISRIAGLFTHYYKAKTSLNGLNNLMKIDVERPYGKTFLNSPDLQGDFEFKDVRFHYPGSKIPVLKSIQTHIKPGEKIALIGRTGSGKSTLLKMLVGLYQPDMGLLTIDGIEASQVDPDDLRSKIGYMPQEPELFSGTLKENILMGHTHIKDSDFLDACEVSGVHDFATKHPEGYDMNIGESGHQLSGGQRQSVSLARALVHQPDIWVFDEPTSSMDNHTESLMINQFKRLIQSKTLIVCTHRMSMLALVDRIIVMDNGTIIADGPKEEVIKNLSKGSI